MTDYSIRKKNIIKNLCRIHLGFQQMICRPYLNIVWILLCVFIALIKSLKEAFVNQINLPCEMKNILSISLNMFLILLPIILIIYIINGIAELTARNYESKLMVAFSVKNLRNGCPILMSKKKQKHTKITICEFYSNIPYAVWIEKKETIADALNAHFIEEIQYSKNNGKRIVIKIAKGRKPIDRGVIYDEQL